MRLLVGFLALLVAAPCIAQDERRWVRAIDIVKKGIYETKDIGKIDSSETATGKLLVVGDIKLVEETTKVPAVLGREFGIQYMVVGFPNGASVPIKLVTVFPKGGLHRSDTGETFKISETVEDVEIGKLAYKGYLFEQDWELVPGTWRVEIWYRDKKYAEQSFSVSKPK